MSADNGLRTNVWKEERRGREGMAGYACRSGAMSIDNGLHLMSGGRRGYKDKKEGWSDEWAGLCGLAWTDMKTNLILVCHAAQTDIDVYILSGMWIVPCLLFVFCVCSFKGHVTLWAKCLSISVTSETDSCACPACDN